MFSLKGKKAVVTGGASGIGAAIAAAFQEAGAEVLVLDRAQPATRIVDVTSEAECLEAAQALGTPDILVNNAGIGHVGTLLGTNAADLDRLYAVNVRGIFNCCKAFAPAMMERGRGSVINMASIGGIVAVRERLAYTATKFAVVGLTKALALDHSKSGVRFNCICPGRVETSFVQGLLKQYADPEAAYRDMASTQLQGRMVKPAEVAAAALYLAADESSMVTGSAFMIDGGWSAGK
jgi:NAD(P)-dependent dehydrogenase (short-subunit alcohol dehydrogenase family)